MPVTETDYILDPYDDFFANLDNENDIEFLLLPSQIADINYDDVIEEQW